MAKASWKYHFFKENEIEDYIDFLSESGSKIEHNTKRHTTLTKLNFHKTYNLYTGKWFFEKKFLLYNVSYKVGQYTKTRKPYYFRSKKKYVTKKNNLQWKFADFKV